MSQLDSIKRIVKEEFKSEDRETIEKLAFILNSFMTQVIDTVNGKIDFRNLNQEVKTINVVVNSNGVPTTTTKIKHNLLTKIQGIICIDARNLTNTTLYPTNAPFLSFTPGEGVATIKNITGLQANNKYSLTLILIGKDI